MTPEKVNERETKRMRKDDWLRENECIGLFFLQRKSKRKDIHYSYELDWSTLLSVVKIIATGFQKQSTQLGQ